MTFNENIEIENGNIQQIGKALSSKTRLEILQLLSEQEMDVSRIAENLGQTEANISAQIKILQKAGLIISHYEPGEHGVRKICKPACKKLTISIIPQNNNTSKKNK